MTILALEFSSSQRSVAVARDGQVLAEAATAGGREMNAFSLIERVLAEARLGRDQIDCLAVGLGPGSYTGIRVALAIAQGWQLARPIRLLGISSADCLAAQGWAMGLRGRVHVVIDAQRGEFYRAVYVVEADGWREVEPLQIQTAAAVTAAAAGEALVGPDLTRWFASGQALAPSAAELARLASRRTDYCAGEKLEPVYLRETTFLKAAPGPVAGRDFLQGLDGAGLSQRPE